MGFGITDALFGGIPDFFSSPTPNTAQIGYGQTLAAQQAAQQAYAPDALAHYQTYAPAYSAEDMKNLQQLLFGREEETVTPDAFIQWRAGSGELADLGRIQAIENALGSAYVDAVAGDSVDVDNKRYTAELNQPDDITISGHEGLLKLYEEDILPQLTRMNAESLSQARAQDIQDISDLSPAALEALREYNPQQTALADKLAEQAMTDLERGRRLSADEYREIEQATRGAQAARGMGFGPADAFAEAMNVGQAAENRYRQRQNFASNIVAQQQALYGDPFMQITGRSSGQSPLAFSAVNQAAGLNAASGPRSFVNESQNAFDIAGYNANALNAASIAQANNRAGVQSGVLNLLGSALSY